MNIGISGRQFGVLANRGIPRAGRTALWLPGGPNVSLNAGLSPWAADGNLLRYSEDLTNAAWQPTGTGGVSGQTVTMPAVDDGIKQIVLTVSSASRVFGIAVTMSGTGTVSLAISNNIDQTSPWQQVTLQPTPTTTTYSFECNATSTGSPVIVIRRRTGDTATSVVVAKTAMYPGSTALPYQATAAKQTVLDPVSGLSLTLGANATVATDDPTPFIQSGKVTGLAFATDDFLSGAALGTVRAMAFAFYTAAPINKDTSGAKLYNSVAAGVDGVNLGSTTSALANEIITVSNPPDAVPYPRSAWCDASATIAAGWHVLVINWNASAGYWSIWLDGQQKPITTNGTPAYFSGTEVFRIGASVAGSQFFIGSIAAFSPFSRSLTDGEVRRTTNDIKRKLTAQRGIAWGW